MTSTLLIALSSLAATAAAPEPVDYLRSVKPILAHRCLACHGALQQKKGLRVDTVALLKQGGDTGAALVPGKPDESPLWLHITGAQGHVRMPPAQDGEGLKESELQLIRRWIEQGATGPTDEKPEDDPKEHWAFRAPVRPALPVLRSSGSKHPIDRLIGAAQEKHGLTPLPAAERGLLLRRVYLDLIGLPPTREETQQFLADSSPDAYEKVVDRLLASKHYGERWGRHWMDIWRYSDWWGLGAEVRNSQKHIWHWRDWIMESLNEDKGYDQMLREMLAADELYPTDARRLRATGYLVRPYFLFNRNSWLDDVIEHTSKGMLGLTMNCARCHDHKYDPLSQEDYYRLRAIFEPYQIRMDMLPGETDYEKNGLPRIYDANQETPTYLFVRGDESRPRTNRPMKPDLPPLLRSEAFKIAPLSLPAEAHRPGLRAEVIQTHVDVAKKRKAEAETQLKKIEPTKVAHGKLHFALAQKQVELAERQLHAVTVRAAADRDPTKSREAATLEARVALAEAELEVCRAELEFAQADAAKKAAPEQKKKAALEARARARKSLENVKGPHTAISGALKIKSSNQDSASTTASYPASSSGRRRAFAQWLTQRQNPLTARVAVNHIWQRHLGRPLVPTLFDFGRKGTPPTHPELLDWLAVEFMEHGWSMKHLHRLIVTSETYQRRSSSAGAPAHPIEKDPENRLYWRRDPVRMEAQVVRDSLLHLAGQLDLTFGGPTVPVQDSGSRRRALYFFQSHNEHNRFLSIFDDANVLECYRRAESIVPQQALALSNSALTGEMAEKMASRLPAEDSAFIQSAFQLILGTTPTGEERAACQQALTEWRALNPERARTNLVLTLLNHNDFVTIR